MDTTLTNLRSLIADYAVIDADQIGTFDSLRSLGLDSLDSIELVSEIEDLFDVEFTDPLPGPDITLAELHTLIQTA